MVEELLTPEWEKWDDLASRLLEEGRDVPADRAARLAVALASGKADVLSGRFISIQDDLDKTVVQAQRIQWGQPYLLWMKYL
jgi:Flp pilus assembly protein TadD